ncbi:MAG TPA: lytic transglycosylase domain-containing protein [Longimicrobiaceae bacterium]|nr:lytic transglycosylase domain-containing protein [Longimicrobiaceae bacterium]
MKKNATNRADRRSKRGDTRALLRSRAVQGVLVLAAVQGVAVGAALKDRDRDAGDLAAARVQHTVVQSLAPSLVIKPMKVAAVKKAAPVRKAEPAVAASPRAQELAEKYRRRGFKVSETLARQIHAAALKYRIDPEVAFGLVKTESGFQNSATSYVGAIGLTQLMPATARWLKPGVTVSQLRDSETNLNIGFRYLRDLIEKYDGDTELALLAYNRGPGTVDRVLRRGGNPDNGYADMVMGRRNSHR